MNRKPPSVSMRTIPAFRDQDEVVKRSSRNSWVLMALAIAFQMTIPCSSQAAPPDSRPRAIRPADYCTVFFAPKLGEKLNLNVIQRVVAAMQYETAMDDAGGRRAANMQEIARRQGFTIPDNVVEVNEDSILRNLDRSGAMMRDALTPAQIATFEKMFKAGEISPVGADMGPTPGMFVVRYTPYGEKDQDKPTKAKAIQHQGDMRMIAAIRNLDEALEVLCSPNKVVNLYGLEWLMFNAKVPNDADRVRVLEALQESLDFAIKAPYQRLNIDCISLFCSWADRTQIKRLQQVCLVRGNAEEARELAVRTLIKLDPEAAEQLVRENVGESSFRVEIKRILDGLKKSSEAPADVVAKLSALIEKPDAASVKPDSGVVVTPPKALVEKPDRQALNGRTQKQPDPLPRPPQPAVDTSAITAGIQSGDDSHVIRGLMNSLKIPQADEELASAVLKVLQESKAVTHRILAARALERWGQADALPALERAAQDKNGMLKNYAQRAIAAINARKNAQPSPKDSDLEVSK